MTPLAPLSLHVLVALAGTFAAIRARSSRPKLLPAYLAFVAVAGITGGITLYSFPAHYRAVFWFAEFAHNALLTALSLEIISDVLPRRFVTPWALFFCSSFILAVVRQSPMTSTPELLSLSISAMATAGMLLLSLVFVPDVIWPRGYASAAVGLAAVIAGNLLPAMQWITGTASPLALQMGDLPGLIVLALVGKGSVFSVSPHPEHLS